MTTIVWHGTEEERRDLLRIAKWACHTLAMDCLKGQRCPVHQMVIDQASLDHLLFARRNRDRLRAEEGCPS